MKLLACPSCARPYDVSNVAPGTTLRCNCDHVFEVSTRSSVAEGITCGHCGAPQDADAAVCGHCRVTLRTVICPQCAVRMPAGAKHCRACGSGLSCQALQPLPEGTDCPRCAGELLVRALDHGSWIECGACHGIWVEPRAFDALCRDAAQRGGSATPGSEQIESPANPIAYIPCLRCNELMVRRQFQWQGRPARVVLDHCRDHGVWLDGQELEVVLAFVREGGPAPGLVASAGAPAAGGAVSLGPASKASLGASILGAIWGFFTDDMF